MALAGELLKSSHQPLEPQSSRELVRAGSASSSSGAHGNRTSLRTRLKQRLQRNRSSVNGDGSGDITAVVGDGSIDDEMARNHRQLLDSLDSQVGRLFSEALSEFHHN
jgi:hypothetical protein